MYPKNLKAFSIKLTIILNLLLLCSALQAQTGKGTINFGTNLTFDFQIPKQDLIPTQQNMAMQVNAGIFVSEKTSLGLGLGYAQIKEQHTTFQDSSTSSNSIMIEEVQIDYSLVMASLFVQRYYNFSERTGLILDFQSSLGFGEMTFRHKDNQLQKSVINLELLATPRVYFMIKHNLSMELGVVGLRVSFSDLQDGPNFLANDETLFSFGLRYYLPK